MMARFLKILQRLMVFCYGLAIVLVHPLEVGALETGYTGEYEEELWLHSDTDSYDSKTTSLNHELMIGFDFQDRFSFTYLAQFKDWTLSHSDGTKYVNLQYGFHRPGVAYKSESVTLKATASYFTITRKPELYNPVADDTTNQFLLPELYGAYAPADLLFEMGAWLENDFQALDYYRYTIFIYQTAMAGIGYRLTEQHQFRLNHYEYDRVYPENYDLNKTESSFLYQFLNPYTLDDRFAWKELSLKYQEIYYPDVTLTELHLSNQLRFRLLTLNHFFTYQLSATNYYTTYRQGVWDYSLIEENNMENDLIQMIEYSGFTRIADSRFFFNWRLTMEDSISRNAYLNRSLQLQLTYTFE